MEIIKQCREIRRFVILHFEPFLSFLSSDRYIKLHTYRDLKNTLKEEVFNSYKGENEDYIEFILEKNITAFESFLSKERRRDFHEIYTLLAKYSLIHVSSSLISNARINNYELYKFVGLYVEPLQILFSYLIHNGIPFDPQNLRETSFYEMDVIKNKKLADLHIHAETSYLFRNLIEFIIRDFNEVYKNISKEDLNLLKDLNFIILTYKGVTGSLTNEESVSLRKLLWSKVTYIIPRTPIFRRFNYRSFVNACIKNIFNNTEEEISLFSVLSLQKLNRIMSSLTFKGEYKGLKHMRHFFNSKIKKIFQKTRHKLDRSKIFIEPVQDCENLSYVELRLSPERDQIEFWSSWLKSNNVKQPEIKFVLHYKKLKNLRELHEFYYTKPSLHLKKETFLSYLENSTNNIVEFLLKNPEMADLIVGFDAASIEYWTPPWIFRDIFKFWKKFFKFFFSKNIGI